MNPRREKFYTRAAIFFVLLFIAYLSVPARAADSDVTIVHQYPLEYCGAMLSASTGIFIARGDLAAHTGELHATALLWFLDSDLNIEVMDLISLKIDALLALGDVSETAVIEDATDCVNAQVKYVKENADE
jgi:hypothetical protein